MPTTETTKTSQSYRAYETDRTCETAARRDRRDAAQGAPLDDHYRAIGISAVAAAMRYQPQTPRAVYAPRLVREQD
jgi:hypothetical protein